MSATVTSPASAGTLSPTNKFFASTADTFRNFMSKTVTSSRNLVENTKANGKQMMDKTGQAGKQMMDKTGQAMNATMTNSKEMMGKTVENTRRSATNLKNAVDEKVIHGTKSAWEKTVAQVSGAMNINLKDGAGNNNNNNVDDRFKDYDPSDVRCDTLSEALEKLTFMIDTVDVDIKWEMQATPFVNNASHQDLYSAFLQWSREEVPLEDSQEGAEATSEEEKKDATKMAYNITKAFERMESYVNWMQEHRSDLTEPKLTAESVQSAAEAWGMDFGHDENGRYVWFLDFAKIQMDAVKKDTGTITLKDSLRYIVYASHVMLFDKQAQENGMVIAISMGYMGLMESMAPLDMAQKLDKYTMGTLPIKLKKIYVLNSARWVGMVMGLMKPFLTQKMRQRVVVLFNKIVDPLHLLGDEIGMACIPETFGRLGAGTPFPRFSFGARISNIDKAATAATQEHNPPPPAE